MANGPFGNPLSTGIALSFEVDMTPYRQMHARKMANIEEKKKERKKQQAELQDILKNITVDTSKVHERYKDDAMNEYAATINDVMSSFKSGNVAGTYQRINKFNNQINSYVNATQNFNNYVKSKGDKTFRNEELIRAMDNVEGVSDDQLLEMFQNDIDYSNGLFNFTVIDRPDLIGHANKVLQGVEKMFMTDDAGNYIKTGKVGPRNKELYRTSIKDPDKFFEGEANFLKNSAGGNRLLMEYGGITPAQLDERDASGRQLRDVLADKYVRELLIPKVYGEVGLDPNVPRVDKPKPSYGFTDDNIGDVSFSGKPSSVVSTESPTPEQIEQARVDKITGEVQKYVTDAIAADPDNVEDKLDMESYLEPFGLAINVPYTYGEEVEITTENGKTSFGKFDPTSNTFVQDLTEIILENGTESHLKTKGGTPETTLEEFLTPESDSFFVNIAGGKKPTTDWAIPAGATVILTGDQGAVEVKLKNDMTFEKGKFQKAAKYKYKSGDTDTYYDIMFPIDKRDNESYFTNLFNDSDVLTDFKIKSPDQLPKSMYVKEDRGLFKSLLSVLQTSKNIGTMTEGSLQKAMDKFMKPLSESGTQSSESSGQTEVDEFGFPIEN